VTSKATNQLTAAAPDGSEITVPLATVQGDSDGPTLAVVAGVHGSEYDGIEAAQQLFRTVDPARLKGRLLIVPCLNVPAFYGLAMHVNPIDGEYPRRMRELAWKGAVSQADYAIDVHGGDLEEELVEYSQVELVGDDDVDARAEGLARALDMPFIVKRVARQKEIGDGGPIPLVASLNGIPGVLIEAGSHGVLDKRCVAAHLRGLRRALHHLGMLDEEPPMEYPLPTELTGFAGIYAPVDGSWYPTVLKGEVIDEGQHLGEMRDFFGEKICDVESDVHAAILGVMTIPPRNEGSMLMGVGTLD
jgi:predicted deacylase